MDGAFSESKDGWAYYSGQGGQLRHGSKTEGQSYGESYSTEDVIGVYVDLVQVSPRKIPIIDINLRFLDCDTR